MEIFTQTLESSIGNDGVYDWYLIDDQFCRALLINAIDIFGYRSGLRYEYPIEQVRYVYINRGYDACANSYGNVIANFMDDLYN